MNLKLIRYKFKDKYTVGKLFVNDEFFCETLEDTLRDKKIKHHTCIPAGKYDVEVTYSPAFKRKLPLIKDVPNFSGIRIHRGNTHKHTSGCILVGEKETNGFLSNSTTYEKKLLKTLENETNIKIIII